MYLKTYILDSIVGVHFGSDSHILDLEYYISRFCRLLIDNHVNVSADHHAAHLFFRSSCNINSSDVLAPAEY